MTSIEGRKAKLEKRTKLQIAKVEYAVVFNMNGSLCKLKIGNTEIKLLQKVRYLRNVLTQDGMCDMETRRCIGLAKDTFKILKRC